MYPPPHTLCRGSPVGHACAGACVHIHTCVYVCTPVVVSGCCRCARPPEYNGGTPPNTPTRIRVGASTYTRAGTYTRPIYATMGLSGDSVFRRGECTTGEMQYYEPVTSLLQAYYKPITSLLVGCMCGVGGWSSPEGNKRCVSACK